MVFFKIIKTNESKTDWKYTNLWWLFLQDGAWLSEDAVDDMAKVKKNSHQSEWRCCLLGMFVYVCIVYTCIYYICKIMVIQHSRLQRLVIHFWMSHFLRSPLVTLQEWFGYLGTLGCSTRLSVCCSFPMIFKILVCQIIRYCQISTIVTTIIVLINIIQCCKLQSILSEWCQLFYLPDICQCGPSVVVRDSACKKTKDMFVLVWDGVHLIYFA